MDVTLDQAACDLLFKMMHPATPEGEDYSEVRLQWGEGHSGKGLYVSLAEYPEEGSVLLVQDKTLREPLAPEVIEAAAAEAFGYEGGLQEVNLGDLLHFARTLEQRHGIGA